MMGEAVNKAKNKDPMQKRETEKFTLSSEIPEQITGQTSLPDEARPVRKAKASGGKADFVLIKNAGKAPMPKGLPGKPRLAEQIGESLQNVYNDILSQPVPDRFLELLRQLENTQTQAISGSKKG